MGNIWKFSPRGRKFVILTFVSSVYKELKYFSDEKRIFSQVN